mmetsp:Transcript_5401/g.13880  ORF Transcript_5401/g.13880 Transcript_5401/m.13880 type:complete len:240 (+) Transcript_5401:1290-2009(+)
MQGQQAFAKHLLVLVLNWHRESTGDGAIYFEDLRNTRVLLGNVGVLEKHIRHRHTHGRAVRHQTAIQAMRDCLDILALTRISRPEQLQKLLTKALTNAALFELDAAEVGPNELEEDFVDEMKMSPCGLIRSCLHYAAAASGDDPKLDELGPITVDVERSQDIDGYHLHKVEKRRIVEPRRALGEKVHELTQRCSLESAGLGFEIWVMELGLEAVERQCAAKDLETEQEVQRLRVGGRAL